MTFVGCIADDKYRDQRMPTHPAVSAALNRMSYAMNPLQEFGNMREGISYVYIYKQNANHQSYFRGSVGGMGTDASITKTKVVMVVRSRERMRDGKQK